MLAKGVKIENDDRNRGRIFTKPTSYWADLERKRPSLSDLYGHLTGIGQAIHSGVESWNRATSAPIPPKFVGGTPENQAARQQFTQDASRAASDLGSLVSPEAMNNRLEPIRDRVDQIRDGIQYGALPRQNLSLSQAENLVSRGPDQKQTLTPEEAIQHLTQNKSGMAGASLPEVFGSGPAPTPAVSPSAPAASPSVGSSFLPSFGRAAASQAATLLPVLFGRSAGIATPGGQQATASPAAAIPSADPAAAQAAPGRSLTAIARASQDPREAIMSAALEGNPGGQYSPAAWEAIQNPALARLAPGERPLPGRENLDLRQTGQPDFRSPGVNPVAPQNAWQPNLGGALPSDQATAIDAARRRADEARNTLMGLTMQAAAEPSFGEQGRVFERTGGPGDYVAYLTAAKASREAAARGDVEEAARLRPGAWQGWTSPNDRRPNADGSMYAGPARSTVDMLSPDQKAGIRSRQQARADSQAIRQQMVTARAQGRSISPAEAAVQHLMARNQQLSPEQKMLAFGQPYITAEGQRQAAEQTANAEVRKAELAAETEKAKLDPEVMRMAAIQAGLANLPNDASMADVNRMMQALRLRGGSEDTIRSGPFAGMTQSQAENAAQLAKDPESLRNYLYTLPGIADEERISEILQQLTGRRNADVSRPGGSVTIPGVIDWLGRFITGH
jgi:hypothetical protein